MKISAIRVFPGVFFQVLLILVFIKPALSQTLVYSQLWGKNGESWDKVRIPDFRESGFGSGKKVIPQFSKNVNVKDFGALGDGVHDDTEALKRAIKSSAKANIFFPKGHYVLSDSIEIDKENIVLKGEDTEGSIITFTRGLEELNPNYNKDWKDQTKWSWCGALFVFKKGVRNSGIENLSIRFPDSTYGGHNWHERGYNAIGFSESANNCWVRGVNIINADMGIWVDETAHHITLKNFILSFDGKRARQNISGHHGLNIYGGHNLVEDFQVNGKFVHDLSIESGSSLYNVFHRGRGKDICIDHHNHAQRNNLFTNIDAGEGSRIYSSGGIAEPRGLSFNETYWNITARGNMLYCDQFDTPKMQSKNNVCIAVKTNKPSDLANKNGNWFETIPPESIFPQDLYEAQMKLKKGK